MDVNQTISDLISQQNIAMENHINRLCYRDLAVYENRLKPKGLRIKDIGVALYNAPDSHAGTTIIMPRFINYIWKNYDCTKALDLDTVSCENENFVEEMSVCLW